MEIIGRTDDGILVEVSAGEFQNITGSAPNNYAIGAAVDLKRLNKLVNVLGGKKENLAEIKQLAKKLYDSIGDLNG